MTQDLIQMITTKIGTWNSGTTQLADSSGNAVTAVGTSGVDLELVSARYNVDFKRKLAGSMDGYYGYWVVNMRDTKATQGSALKKFKPFLIKFSLREGYFCAVGDCATDNNVTI